MNRRWASIGMALLVAGLSGCATMNADECATVDWTTVGYEDGSRGYTTERIGKHRKACAKHGVTPDFQAYQNGRNRGLEEFCQPGRGFNHGANGGNYHGVCPADMEPEYLEAYRAGNKLYTLRAGVSSANSQIYSKEHELERIESRTTSVEVQLISDQTTTEQRVVLLQELKDMSKHSGELEAEIKQLIDERARLDQDLQYYEQTVAAYGY